MIQEDYLDIESDVQFDESVVSIEERSHQPYSSTTMNNSDEIRIPLQHQDAYTLPSRSYLYVEGAITDAENDTPSTNALLTNNAVSFLFGEIRYELNGVAVDHVRQPGIANTLKGLASFTKSRVEGELSNSGWYTPGGGSTAIFHTETGNFSACTPLNTLFGFAEDYRKLVINAKQELILIRARTDADAYVLLPSTPKVKITINKIVWRMPHVSVSDVYRLKFLRTLEKDRPLHISFRKWELHEYSSLPSTKNLVWAVKTSSQIEKPRYVMVAFQTNRRGVDGKDSSSFDHCQLVNVKLYLNSETYPYESLKLDFAKGRSALLYEMYNNFRYSYYGVRDGEPLMDRKKFSSSPFVVLDCSKQNESVKTGAVDVRLELETAENFPTNTTAYCLVIHDRIVDYNPLTGSVHVASQ